MALLSSGVISHKETSVSAEEKHISDFFAEYGLQAHKIRESDEKSPDFYIEAHGAKILVELKTKFDDEELMKSREKAFAKDELFEYSTIWDRKNSISSAISKAYKQLSHRKKKIGADFCYVFLLATGNYTSAQLRQFESTLYGSKEILSSKHGSPEPQKKTCYYYTFSDFYRYKEVIDGAFILGKNFGRLCLNDQSVQYPSARESAFVKAFLPGVLDPQQLEEDGKAYSITESIDRRDKELLNEYLKSKYKLEKIIAFNWPQLTVISRIS